MKVINIKNGILLDYNRDYSVYEMYTNDGNEYYMCIANYDVEKYEVVIDFVEEYFNSLLNEEKVAEIKKTCNNLFTNGQPYIYILPNITTYDLKEANDDNDDRAYQVLLRRIQKYTYDIYKSITNNNEDVKIDQVIRVIIDTENDKKFIDWLDVNLNGYFNAMKIKNKEELSNNEVLVQNDINNNELVEQKVKTKTLKINNKGFGNIAFIFLVIVIAIIIGIVILK